MATICIKNFPADLHEAIRKKARENRSSMRAEVIRVLKENVVTAAQLRRRRKIIDKLSELRGTKSPGNDPFPHG
ncbi:MAG TPA: hypothetical protein VF011_17620 [Terriglobales bacterium]